MRNRILVTAISTLSLSFVVVPAAAADSPSVPCWSACEEVVETDCGAYEQQISELLTQQDFHLRKIDTLRDENFNLLSALNTTTDDLNLVTYHLQKSQQTNLEDSLYIERLDSQIAKQRNTIQRLRAKLRKR